MYIINGRKYQAMFAGHELINLETFKVTPTIENN